MMIDRYRYQKPVFSNFNNAIAAEYDALKNIPQKLDIGDSFWNQLKDEAQDESTNKVVKIIEFLHLHEELFCSVENL